VREIGLSITIRHEYPESHKSHSPISAGPDAHGHHYPPLPAHMGPLLRPIQLQTGRRLRHSSRQRGAAIWCPDKREVSVYRYRVGLTPRSHACRSATGVHLPDGPRRGCLVVEGKGARSHELAGVRAVILTRTHTEVLGGRGCAEGDHSEERRCAPSSRHAFRLPAHEIL
jgi:hypothetical protein